MTTSARKRTNILGFLGILALSSATMVWMLWRFPIATGVATLIVLSVYGVSARLARSIESDGLTELKRGNQGA